MSDQARGAIVEIIQSRRPATDTLGGSVIVPDKVRINGQEVLLPEDEPVRVESIDVGEGIAIVQLRVMARLVLIGTNDDAAALAEGLRR